MSALAVDRHLHDLESSSAPSDPLLGSTAAKIAKLREWKTSGIITADEFTAQVSVLVNADGGAASHRERAARVAVRPRQEDLGAEAASPGDAEQPRPDPAAEIGPRIARRRQANADAPIDRRHIRTTSAGEKGQGCQGSTVAPSVGAE